MEVIISIVATAVVMSVIFLLIFRHMNIGDITFEREDGIPCNWVTRIDSRIGILTDLPHKKYVIFRIRERENYNSFNEEDNYRKEI